MVNRMQGYPYSLVAVNTDMLDYEEQQALDTELRGEGWEPEQVTPHKRYYQVSTGDDCDITVEFKHATKRVLQEPGAASCRVEGTFNQTIPERDYV